MFKAFRERFASAQEVLRNPPPGGYKAIRDEMARRLAEQYLAARVELADYGLRHPSELRSTSFDPFNLTVRSVPTADLATECDLVFAGKFDELKRVALSKISTLEEDEKIKYVLQVTNEFHELRHYHDHFGTTYGFQRIYETIMDAVEFGRLWDVLRARGRIKLPLTKWAKSPDAPQELLAYLERRRGYLEWMKVSDGLLDQEVASDTNNGEPVDANTAEKMVPIRVRGRTIQIPAAIFNYKIDENGLVFQSSIRLGGALIMEGTAFATQRVAANWLFGEEYARKIKVHQTVSRGYTDETRWRLYMAGDLYLTKHLIKFYEKYQLALSDLAMMNLVEGNNDLTETDHPGWRFSKATHAAKSKSSVHQKHRGDLKNYSDSIARRLGWMTISEVAELAAERTEKRLAELDRSPEVGTFWPSVLRAALNLHHEWMKIRIACPTVLAEPLLYLKWLPRFPAPPAYQGRRGLVFRGVTPDDALAFERWFMFEHFQRQLLFSDRLPCPMTSVHPHKCPGDPLRKWRWSPSDQCNFARTMDLLGVRQVKVEAA
jgi:heme oxygenase